MVFSHLSRLVFKHITFWVFIVHLSVESLFDIENYLQAAWNFMITDYLICDFLMYK